MDVKSRRADRRDRRRKRMQAADDILDSFFGGSSCISSSSSSSRGRSRSRKQVSSNSKNNKRDEAVHCLTNIRKDNPKSARRSPGLPDAHCQNQKAEKADEFSDQSPSNTGARWEFATCTSEPIAWAPFHPTENSFVDRSWKNWWESDQGASEIECLIKGCTYKVNFENMTQRNCRTGYVRSIRRRSARASDTERELRVQLSSMEFKLAAHQRELSVKKSQIAALENERANLVAEKMAQKQQIDHYELQIFSQQKLIQDLQLKESSDTKVLEVWKSSLGSASYHIPEPIVCQRSFLKAKVQAMLQCLLPTDFKLHQHPKCLEACQVVVQSVEQVMNVGLWKKYCFEKEQIANALKHRDDCPWADEIAPGLQQLHEHLDYFLLTRGANEVLLLHGTTCSNAQQIVRQGFDDRLSVLGLYGPGIYLTPDFCKAFQYCKDQDKKGFCVFIARAVLGHPYMTNGPRGRERPPIAEPHGVPYDSVIARPGIPNGQPTHPKQIHWEFVVPSAQAYPELLVRFKV
eukprot:TRINITY_DN7416_c3_g1_i1.p1 TRINITY_DN7416_c3_g1~~TRINITY_DN7416_c3_g1_i1.p1  ORF type:complete len:534 (-),score=66.12 TRINITY_DN7416_c3_g1_i1:454-2007(-)